MFSFLSINIIRQIHPFFDINVVLGAQLSAMDISDVSLLQIQKLVILKLFELCRKSRGADCIQSRVYQILLLRTMLVANKFVEWILLLSCPKTILLILSLICYSFPLQDKLKSHPFQQQPLVQLLAFGHHELRHAASSQKSTGFLGGPVLQRGVSE
ncbi:uncharacterized protein [Nicotiana sylvestris]|uniref:uncharacterized protein isoform X2 n=1 Tax=Nicotiana sylvestris TaxID=4096 RepID=UPI00388C357D